MGGGVGDEDAKFGAVDDGAGEEIVGLFRGAESRSKGVDGFLDKRHFNAEGDGDARFARIASGGDVTRRATCHNVNRAEDGVCGAKRSVDALRGAKNH